MIVVVFIGVSYKFWRNWFIHFAFSVIATAATLFSCPFNVASGEKSRPLHIRSVVSNDAVTRISPLVGEYFNDFINERCAGIVYKTLCCRNSCIIHVLSSPPEARCHPFGEKSSASNCDACLYYTKEMKNKWDVSFRN